MGLDTSYDAWSGGYGSFNIWRTEVARAAGYPLENKYGSTLDYVLDWDAYTQRNYWGEWEETPEDILLVLLAHSDCDGEIAAEHCTPLAERLKELLLLISTEPLYPGSKWSHNSSTVQFIAGLLAAAEDGEPIEFY